MCPCLFRTSLLTYVPDICLWRFHILSTHRHPWTATHIYLHSYQYSPSYCLSSDERSPRPHKATQYSFPTPITASLDKPSYLYPSCLTCNCTYWLSGDVKPEPKPLLHKPEQQQNKRSARRGAGRSCENKIYVKYKVNQSSRSVKFCIKKAGKNVFFSILQLIKSCMQLFF